MSIAEVSAPHAGERRGDPRIRPTEAIPITVGRGPGVLFDISISGARVHHSLGLRRGAITRISFDWQNSRFSSCCEVMSCSVLTLGGGPGGATLYDSRLRFATLDFSSRNLLSRVISSLDDSNVRRWVANLRGWSDGTITTATSQVGVPAYRRCSLMPDRWDIRWTRDDSQPGEGFTLPASVSRSEVQQLCGSYAASDSDGRHLIRLMARAVLAASKSELPRSA